MKTTIPILTLKPTQFAIGMEEVKQKIKELNKCGKKKRGKFLKNHRVPVVISPHGFYYALDHHHAIWALWSTGVSEVQIEVIKDFSKSKYSFKKFWALMVRSKWAHFFREKKLLHSEGRLGFEQCIKRALRLARSGAAKKLPGFLG